MEFILLENTAVRHTIVYQSLDQLKKIYPDLEIENLRKTANSIDK